MPMRGMQRGMQQRGAQRQQRRGPAGGMAPRQPAPQAAMAQRPQRQQAPPPAAAPAQAAMAPGRTPAVAAAAQPAMSQAMGAHPMGLAGMRAAAGQMGLAAPHALQGWQRQGLNRATAAGNQAQFLTNHPGVQAHMNKVAAIQQGLAGNMAGDTGDPVGAGAQVPLPPGTVPL